LTLKNILLALTILFIGTTTQGCIHNYEPVISTISAEPNPVPQGGIVSLICNASDDDDSSKLKNESLTYVWFAATGEIISQDSDNTATWTAPQEPGKYSISCSVSDESDGMDILTIDILVQ
jgi:hypothetical protein|tara:strand:+ start:5360 stop:5722 length:363 start_codon:yes stop_codon:yes gene_type:complete